MLYRIFIAGLLLIGTPAVLFAQAQWQIREIDAKSVPKEIVPDPRELAHDGLPDGRIAKFTRNGKALKAWYSEPTTRYNHAVLGDNIEAGALVVELPSGRKMRYRLGASEVFEDITPRITDLDGDGRVEIITIVSHLAGGAGIAVFNVESDILIRSATSAYIGRPFRWLNIADIQRYTGNKTPEIAIVVTPHIGGRLDLLKYTRRKFYLLMSEKGFSNHKIGSRELRLSASFAASNGKQANLALPSSDRKALILMEASSRGWKQIGIAKLPGEITKAIGRKGSGEKTIFTVGLSDGRVFEVFNGKAQ